MFAQDKRGKQCFFVNTKSYGNVASCNEQATPDPLLHLDPFRELQPLQLPKFNNSHGPIFGPGVDWGTQKTAEVSAIWPLLLKRRSPVSPFPLSILSVPNVLPVPNLRKSALVSSQHQYEQQPGWQYQPSCFLDQRITKSREKSNSLVFDQLLLSVFEDGASKQSDRTILWQAACDPSLCCVCVLEKHYLNLSWDFLQ